MSVREDAVLQPLKASIKNPDDWPEFGLNHINITSLKTGRNVSLLSAHKDHPLRVVGRLGLIDDDLIDLVRDKSNQKSLIEIDHVTTYAFAKYADGTYGFWAAGKAGWFELKSATASFKTTYDKMNEAAWIFYMLADRERRAHRKARLLNEKELKKYVKKVFQAYFSQRKDPTHPADVDEARAMFHEHREFLMTSMLEGQDGINWLDAPMLAYFRSEYPDEYAAIENRVTTSSAVSLARSEAKDSRQSSRKRKSKSPHDNSEAKKKSRRKAAQQAESRIQKLPKGLLPETPQAKEVPDNTSSADEDEDNLNLVGRKQKSILQPSGGKYSKKAAARQKGLQRETGNEDDDGNNCSQMAESPITVLRSGRQLEALTNPPASHSSPESTPPPKAMPRKYLELQVVEYELPSTLPQGPGELWTCTFDGCSHRVHEASSLEGKRRVQDHFKSHASQAQEKIDLVLTESRPYLPVK
ncbi:hypothetical protein ACLMJK_000675 [Lecanora helva]